MFRSGCSGAYPDVTLDVRTTSGAPIVSSDGGSSWSVRSSGLGLRTYMTIPPVYTTTGPLVSSPHDANHASTGIPHRTGLSWPAATPANTSVALRLAVSGTPSGPFTFAGPDGTSGTFFTTKTATLSGAPFEGRYPECNAFLGTTDKTATPALAGVTVCYDNTCAGLADGDGCTTQDACRADACGGGALRDGDIASCP